MQRSKKLSRLMFSLSLMLFASHAARANQPARKNASHSGWAIIFASDYKGPSDPLYVSAQYDAIMAYRTLVTDMHYDPDHIVVLADGGKDSPLDDFVKNRNTPPAMDGKDAFQKAEGWKNYVADTLRVSKQLDALDNNPNISTEMHHRILDFRDFTVVGNQVPFFGPATAKNFLTARDVISHLAQANDSVTIIISAHASPDPNVIVANPGEDSKKDGDKPDPNDCLKAADITLPGCPATKRMLVLDNSLRYYDENIPSSEDGKKFANAVKSAFATDNSVVLMASDGTGVSWPKTTLGGADKYILVGSAFLQSAFLAIHQSPNSTCAEHISKIELSFRGRMAGLKHTVSTELQVTPVSYKSVAPYSSAAKVEHLEMVALLNAPVTDTSNVKQELVSYKEVRMDPIPGTNAMYQLRIKGSVLGNVSASRREKIMGRLKALLKEKLTSQEISDETAGIRAAKSSNGYDVVKMPTKFVYTDEKNVDYLVTVDESFARMIGEVPEKGKKINLVRVATKLAKKFCKALTVTGQNTLAGDDPPPAEYQGMGMEHYNKGTVEGYREAIPFFVKALERDNMLFNSYVWLSRSLFEIGQNDWAKRKLSEMRAVLQETGMSLEPEQEKVAKELEAR